MLKEKIKLAIVIPYFKLTFFEDTLKSLANQNNKNFNVYIGDDASPQCPKYILEKYKNKINFVYKKFDRNLGSSSLVKQWERCIDLIEDEEWIMILGDDDYLEDTVIASWYNSYHEFSEKVNVVRFATQSLDVEKKTLSCLYTHPVWEKPGDAYYRNLKDLTRSSLSEYIFSKQAYLKHGFRDYPLAWYSDDQAWLDFSENKYIYSINSSCLTIGVSSSSITGMNNNFDLKNKALLLFYKNNIIERLKEFPEELQVYFLKYYEIYLKLFKKTLTMSDWKFLFKYHIKNFKFIAFFKLIRRFLLFLIKKIV